MTDFQMTRDVRFSETDMAGVAHFSCFYRWMEDAEHAFLRSLGLSVESDQDGHRISFPRVNATCDFQGSARFQETVDIRIRVAAVGTKSVSYEGEFFVGDKRIAVARMTSVCCKVDQGRFESIPIPEKYRMQLEAAATNA